MKTFKQHLIERSEEKALKLLAYLKNRHSDKDGQVKTSHNIDNVHYELQKDHEINLRRSQILRMDTLKPLQDKVVVDKVKDKINKSDDNHGPIIVVKYKGQHYVADGHHRWFAHRLLGKKTINANVVHLD